MAVGGAVDYFLHDCLQVLLYALAVCHYALPGGSGLDVDDVVE